MRVNIDAGLGLTMSSRLADRLSDEVGRTVAHGLVGELCSIARTERRQLAHVAREDARVAHVISDDEVEALADPATYLGSAGALVDRAVADHRRHRTAASVE